MGYGTFWACGEGLSACIGVDMLTCRHASLTGMCDVDEECRDGNMILALGFHRGAGGGAEHEPSHGIGEDSAPRTQRAREDSQGPPTTQHIEAGGALDGANDETAAACVVPLTVGLRDEGQRIEDESPHGDVASPAFRRSWRRWRWRSRGGLSTAVEVAPGGRACVDLKHPIRPSPECLWALEAIVASGIEMSPQGQPEPVKRRDAADTKFSRSPDTASPMFIGP
jgi:hypothetical protein